MSNKASSQVHELIHALSPPEKRYFKLYAERHTGSAKNNYHQLFRAIESQAVYDETEILAQFKDAPFINYFSIAKNRLYHQILKSLDAYHSESSVEAELQRYLHYVEILFHKTLYNQCARILATAEKIAQKHEKTLVQLRIINWKKKLIEVRHHEENNPKLYIDQEHLIDELHKGNQLWKIKAEVFEDLFRTGQARDDETVNTSSETLQTLHSLKDKSSLFETNHLILHTESAIYFKLGKYSKCHETLLQNKSLIETHLHLISEKPMLYHSVLTNLIYVSAKLNRFEEVEKFLAESRSLPGKLKISVTEHIEYRIFSDSYELELAICKLTGNTLRGEQLVEELPPMLEKWENQQGDVKRATFFHGLSVMFFMLGTLPQALKWNNELLNTISIKKAEDSFCFGQMFHAVLHYEMGNMGLLPGISKSLKRYLDTRERRYKFEDFFLELLGNLSSTVRKSDTSIHFRTFLKSITALENEPFEKIAFEYFDFIAWSKSHLSDLTYQEVVSERVCTKDVL